MLCLGGLWHALGHICHTYVWVGVFKVCVIHPHMVWVDVLEVYVMPEATSDKV